ncbi:MAG: hypothetical protein ACRED9_10865 [Caulobacteraceae bacterium]
MRIVFEEIFVQTVEGPKPTRKGVAVPLASLEALAAAVVAEVREATCEAA